MPTIGNVPHQVRQASGEPTDRIEWDGEGFYGGEIAAIIIGATIAASIIAAAVLFFIKRKTQREFRQRQKEKHMALENGDNAVVEDGIVTDNTATTAGPDVEKTAPTADTGLKNNGHVGGAGSHAVTRDHAPPAGDVAVSNGVGGHGHAAGGHP